METAQEMKFQSSRGGLGLRPAGVWKIRFESIAALRADLEFGPLISAALRLRPERVDCRLPVF